MGAARLAAQQDLFGKQNSVGEKKPFEMDLLQCLIALVFCLAACWSANTFQSLRNLWKCEIDLMVGLVSYWTVKVLKENNNGRTCGNESAHKLYLDNM